MSELRQFWTPRAALVLTALVGGPLWLGCSSQPEKAPQPRVDSAPPEGDSAKRAEKDATTDKTVPPGDPPPAGAGTQAELKQPPVFDGWKKPVLTLLVTGQQMGYIEPCGCTGLANQKGGLARRATLLKELREKRGWTVVPLDVGNQVLRYGRQSEIKFQRTAEALRMMGYRAAALGIDDLKLNSGELLAAVKPDDKQSLFTAANVVLVVREFTPPWKIVEAGGKKIGVVAVLGDSLSQKLQGDDVVHTPAGESLAEAVREVQAAGCDFYVLLAHASLDESRELAKSAGIFDLVVTAGGSGEPTFELEKIEGAKSQMVQVGTKGMYAGVVGWFDDPQTPLKYERVPLDSSYADAPEMLKLLADYQEQLRLDGLDGVGASQQPHPSGNKFVGTAKCGECHSKALAVWEKTPHAHATDVVVKPPNERGHIARHFDPECLSCHVTGWEPQKFFPFTSGYLGLEKTPHLLHNGCENCHGPGSAHVAAEEDDAAGDRKDSLRAAMRLPLAGNKAKFKCLECHDLDNDPHFEFEKYWPKVEHVGKD